MNPDIIKDWWETAKADPMGTAEGLGEAALAIDGVVEVGEGIIEYFGEPVPVSEEP